MIKAVLIDDEAHCLESLSMLLADCCPQVEIVGRFSSSLKALDALRSLEPELVFLDIEMPLMNGFELLQHYQPVPFAVIFTTSFDQYAIKAIRFSALDYLLKPLEASELAAAVHRAQLKKAPTEEQMHLLADKMQHPAVGLSRFAIPTAEGFELVAADQVLYCEAKDNYTCFYLKNKLKLLACRTLKEVEELLEDFQFLRVHHSYIVNINEVIKYIRGEGGYLVLSDGSNISVSRSRKEALMKRIT